MQNNRMFIKILPLTVTGCEIRTPMKYSNDGDQFSQLENGMLTLFVFLVVGNHVHCSVERNYSPSF